MGEAVMGEAKIMVGEDFCSGGGRRSTAVLEVEDVRLSALWKTREKQERRGEWRGVRRQATGMGGGGVRREEEEEEGWSFLLSNSSLTRRIGRLARCSGSLDE